MQRLSGSVAIVIALVLALKAEAITPLPVQGPADAQAIRAAYNALLSGIERLPEGASSGYIKSLDARGNISVSCSPRRLGGTAEQTREAEGTATLTTGKSIHYNTAVVQRGIKVVETSEQRGKNIFKPLKTWMRMETLTFNLKATDSWESNTRTFKEIQTAVLFTR